MKNTVGSRSRKLVVLAISFGLLTSIFAGASNATADGIGGVGGGGMTNPTPPPPVITYWVHYLFGNSDSGTPPPDPSPNAFTSGQTLYVDGVGALQKPGNLFDGWMDCSTNAPVGHNWAMVGNINLCPIWISKSQTVIYDANGGSGIMSNQTASVATNLTTNAFTRAGYTFGSWNSDPAGGPMGMHFNNGDSYPFVTSIKLYAQWVINTTFTVTYDGNCANTCGTVPVDNTQYTPNFTVNVGVPPSQNKPGYTFGGWSMPGGMGPQIVTSFPILMNTTLTAVWNAAKTYMVTYMGDQYSTGLPPSDTTHYLLGDPVTLKGPNTLVRPGYLLTGWFDCLPPNITETNPFPIPGNIDLCPIWIPNGPQIVTFVSNFGTDVLKTQTATGTTPLAGNTFLRTGYTFNSWNSDRAGGGIGRHFADHDPYDFLGPITLFAQWTLLPTFTVTYDGNCSNSCGAVPIDGTSYSPNAPVTVGIAPNANYPGFHFTGWSTGGGLGPVVTYQPNGHFPITSNTVLTAVWVANVTYTVTYFPYQTSGGIPPVDLLNPYSSGDVVFVLGASTLFKTGYTFNGWGNCPAVTTVGNSFVIHNDTTLCSLWVIDSKFKVTYLGNGQSTGNPPPIASGSGYVAILGNIGSMTKSGYVFSGWNTKANGLGIPYAIGFLYNRIADLTLYAVWTPAKTTYTITYNGNGNSGGTAPNPTTGAGSVMLATNTGLLVKGGNHIGNWNTRADGSGVTYLLGASYNLIANITLYAMWTPDTYTITYDGNGFTSGAVPNPTVGSGPVTLATNSGALAKNGNTYIGWNTAIDGSGTSYAVGDPYTLSANITLYAVWLPVTLSVTYVGNGNTAGTVPIDITAYSSGGTVFVLGPNTLANTGYTFGGWALGGLGVYAPGQTFTITGDTVLTAIWTPNVIYTITYSGNAQSGGNVPSPTIGSGPVILATNSGALVKSGFSFAGWNTASDGSGTAYAVESPYTLNANITLYAVWMGGGMTNCTIIYNGNGFTGGSVPSPTVGMGSVTLATNSGSLVRAGYTFGGWNTTADGSGTPYAVGSNYNLHVDITLYAVWHPIAIPVYTITYLGNGYTSGSVPLPTIGLGSVTLATNSGALGKNGSTFGGWNTSADGSGTPYSVGSNYTLLADITLYAVWHAVNVVYTITYLGNTNTGGVVPSPTVGAGSVNLAINSGPLVKSASVFGGWNTSASGTGTPYVVGSNYALLADVNLYAVWIAGNPIYTITYSGNTNTGGVVPSPTVGSGSVTLAANSSPLVKTASTFGDWNTKVDGTGTSYATRSNYNLSANITLYAVWSASTTYTITYLGNGNTGGTVPSPTVGSGLVVLAPNSGGLAKTGSTFSGWNTKSDRSGTSYLVASNYSLTSNVTLYAAYIPLPLSQTIPDIFGNGKIINTAPQKKIALNQIVPVHQKFITLLPGNAVGFELYENGRLINRGTSTSVDLTQIVGPKDRVTVVAVSQDGLKSAPAPVSLAKEPISLANINFNTDSFKFIGPATKILDQVAAVIIQHGYRVLEIWGYVDTQGSKASWITLSNNRAKAVKDYMTKKLKGSGVLIKNAGRAQTQAVGNNNTAEGRALNRRVEIRVS